MNFNAPLLRPVRMLLFPFSLIYALVIWIRNKLFDKGMLSSSSFNIPIIGVGNLVAGGTGKSPMVEFIARRLSGRYQMAILSRGYKRKTRGYALANDKSSALEIGDEPMQFHNKFPSVTVAVGEERIVAIPQLLHDRPDTEVIMLDDAFQHRYVKAGLDILLTDYNNLFTRDWYLPTGDLRDLPSSSKRADIVVVTKCPPHLPEEDRDEIINEINPRDGQPVFFTSIVYGRPYHISTGERSNITEQTEVLLVSGIADPSPLKEYLSDNTESYDELLFGDHHIFTIDDLKEIRKRFDRMTTADKKIVTTEKDAVRLTKFNQSIADYPFYVLPIEVSFLYGQENTFTDLISNFIARFNKQKQEI